MTSRLAVLLLLATGVFPAAGFGQKPAPRAPTGVIAPGRAIRRDMPMTRMIQRAFAASTRDSSGKPGRRYWQLWVDYSIDARLDSATSKVEAREHVVIHNTSDSAMRVVVLRLDQNIFAPTVPRAEAVPETTEGMRLTRLVANGQTIDLADPQFGATVARVPLATPIAPGAAGALDVEWNFRVPLIRKGRGFRMGRWGDTLYQVAQWYPRVAMFDDLRQGGWDTDPYLGTSEFYNNFGHFDVRLDVPGGWLVGATGVLQNPGDVLTPRSRDRLAKVLASDSVQAIVLPDEVGPGKATTPGDRLIWHFVADTAADVAWATASRFVWDATRATIPGRGAVPIHMLYLPGNKKLFADAGPVARHALEFYSKLWMPYAFPQLTMVDGPEDGMEYPMFVMSGSDAGDHEVGHQWWPMMVGVNETWYGFMDEGFNTYMNILSDADTAHRPPPLDSLGQRYGRMSGNEREPALMWDANYGGPAYGFQAYGKAQQMLSMLGGIVGDSAVWRAMSGYAQAWRFKHPSPWDFAFFMNRALKRDLNWFWYYWLFTTESVDGSIAKVTTGTRGTTVTVRQNGQMPSPVVLKVEFASRGPKIIPMRNSVMADSTTAIVTFPVDVWFTGRRAVTLPLKFGGRKIEKITLDPSARFPDTNPADNVWSNASSAPAP